MTDSKSKPLPLTKEDKAQAVRLILALAANPVRIKQDRERDEIARLLYTRVIYPDPKTRARLARAPEGDYAVIQGIRVKNIGRHHTIVGIENLKMRVRSNERHYGNAVDAIMSWNDHADMIERVRSYFDKDKETLDTLDRIRAQLNVTISTIKHHADIVAAFPDYADDIRKTIKPRYRADTALAVPVRSIMCAIAGLQGVPRDGCADGQIDDSKETAR